MPGRQRKDVTAADALAVDALASLAAGPSLHPSSDPSTESGEIVEDTPAVGSSATSAFTPVSPRCVTVRDSTFPPGLREYAAASARPTPWTLTGEEYIFIRNACDSAMACGADSVSAVRAAAIAFSAAYPAVAAARVAAYRVASPIATSPPIKRRRL
eukprot:gene17540-23861_t